MSPNLSLKSMKEGPDLNDLDTGQSVEAGGSILILLQKEDHELESEDLMRFEGEGGFHETQKLNKDRV